MRSFRVMYFHKRNKFLSFHIFLVQCHTTMAWMDMSLGCDTVGLKSSLLKNHEGLS